MQQSVCNLTNQRAAFTGSINSQIKLHTNQLALWISPRSEHCAYESRRPSFSCASEGALCNSTGRSAESGIPAIAAKELILKPRGCGKGAVRVRPAVKFNGSWNLINTSL